MKCQKCGTENPQGKSVCRKCGAFLYSSNPHNRVPLTPEQKKSRRKAILAGSLKGCFWSGLIIIGAFIVLAVISILLVKYVFPQDLLNTAATTAATITGTT